MKEGLPDVEGMDRVPIAAFCRNPLRVAQCHEMTGLVHEDPEKTEEAMAVYRPGFSLVESLKGAVGRFLPGALVGVAAGLSFMQGLPNASELVEALFVILVGALGMTAAFAAGLESLRRGLYPDAKITGRRSFIAGLMAPVGIFVAGVLFGPVGWTKLLAMVFAVPFVLALLMFFAWLTPTPVELRDEEYVESDELPGMLLRSWPKESEGGAPVLRAVETATAPIPRGTG